MGIRLGTGPSPRAFKDHEQRNTVRRGAADGRVHSAEHRVAPSWNDTRSNKDDQERPRGEFVVSAILFIDSISAGGITGIRKSRAMGRVYA